MEQELDARAACDSESAAGPIGSRGGTRFVTHPENDSHRFVRWIASNQTGYRDRGATPNLAP